MYTGTISAKRLGASVNAAAIPMVFGLDADDTGDDLDATVGDDDGFGDSDVGVRQMSFTVRIRIDVTVGVSSIRTGDQLTNFAFFYDRNQPAAITAAKVKVMNAKRTAEVRGQWEYTLALKTRGAYTINL